MFALNMDTHPRAYRLLLFVCTVALLAAPLSAVDRTGPLVAAGASEDTKKAVEGKGYHIALDEGRTADFWFARALATGGNGAAGALYPDLANGEFVGVVSFPKGSSDFRGQAIPAGTYTLRYQYIPQDANHMGVSPNPDFLLAVPVASDASPGENMPLQRLVSLSAKASGTAHPAVIALAPANANLGVAKDDQGMTIFTVELAMTTGKGKKIGIVVKGQATQ